MTEEQMRHNALVYLTEGYDEYHRDQLLNGEDTPHPVHERPIVEAHVAGAHSRDKEVNDLEKALANVNELCHQQRNKIYELRHPWVKADERKPKESKNQHGFSEVVILRSDKGECMTGFYHYDTDTWYLYAGSMTRDDQIFGRIVEWMKIPK